MTHQEIMELLSPVMETIYYAEEHNLHEYDPRWSDTCKKIKKQMEHAIHEISKMDNYLIMRDPFDGEAITHRYHSKEETLFTAAKHICFSDCDETYRLEKIVVCGREVVYAGWQPAMLYEFVDKETGEVIYSRQFLHWDH